MLSPWRYLLPPGIDDLALGQTIRLGLEYAPAPPFDAGRPETAPASSLAAYRDQMAHVLPRREAASRLGLGWG
jgi:cyclohexyl-isocyanide hydratase